jgi:hypothetical protein
MEFMPAAFVLPHPLLHFVLTVNLYLTVFNSQGCIQNKNKVLLINETCIKITYL